MPFFAGKNGSISVGGTTQPLTEWSLDVKTESLDITTFASAGVQEVMGGIFSGEISASGPYDGASGVTQGVVADFVLNVGTTATVVGPSFTLKALVTSVKVDTSVKDVVKISYSATSHGSITTSP